MHKVYVSYSLWCFSCTSQQHIIDPVRKALDYYTEMEKALEREKQNRVQSEKTNKPSQEPEAHSESSRGAKPL